MSTETVPKGYKRTEVGMIPEEWEIKPFQALANIERGKFTARPRNDPKYFGGNIPFIQTGDVANSNGQIRNFTQTLNEEGLRVSKSFPCGTIFFTIAANIGDIGFASFDAACPDSLVAISVKDGVDRYWLANELKSRKSAFENLATHNAQLNINLEKLRPYLLPVPTRGEQQAIAAALSDADALIESLEQLVAKKRQIKQGAMQELLTGKRRLPGFSGEWESKRLGDLAKMGSGGTPSSSNAEYYDGSIPWVSIADMTKRGKFISETDRNISEQGLRNSSAQLFPSGTILYAMYASIGECSIAATEVTTSQAILGIQLGPALDKNFLYFVLCSYKDSVKLLGQQGTQANLNKGIVEDFQVQTPTLPEQTAIAAVLSDMDAELEALEAKLDKARQVKQGMMQELLTGKVRLV